jgi:hypothetical protein
MNTLEEFKKAVAYVAMSKREVEIIKQWRARRTAAYQT